MTPSTSKRLTIFEGPDGGGKSTAAQGYAKLTGARYVHFGPLPNVKDGLARMYVEAMMPAVLGYQDVVFDRCWLSEVPYGAVFRGGIDRLGISSVRMLERLALRCGAVVVYCQPSWNVVRSNYLARKELEYLENADQLRHVYEVYASQNPGLPAVVFDYTDDVEIEAFTDFIDKERSPCHSLNIASAGNAAGSVILVGESFGERKNQDPWYQWPFASFTGLGCSEWLANQLEKAKIAELDILWVNADQDLTLLKPKGHALVIALGVEADQALTVAGFPHATCPHPQSWKRFHAGKRYPLIDIIEGWYENN